MKKRFSIRSYLTGHLVVWSFLMTSIPAVMVYYDTLHEVDELFDASLVQTAKVLNGLISRKALEQNKQHLIDSLLAKDTNLIIDKHHPYEKKLYFQIWDKTGLVVKSKLAPDIAFGHLEAGFHKIETDKDSWLSFAMYSQHDDWWLVVGERHDIRGELALDIVKAHVLPITVFIPLLLLVVSIVLIRGFSPLNFLRQEISQRKYKQLTQIDNSQSPEEVAALVDSLNELLIRLQKAQDKESQFVSDVAHELRTPLSGLLIHTENLIEDIDESSVVSDLIDMKYSILRLSHLVNQLLISSRSSRDIQPGELADINLRTIILQALADNENQRESKQLNIDTQLADTSVLGNETLLSSLVCNIIDNAVRYTPEQGQIKIRCHSLDDQSLELTVEDSGPGIPSDLYSKVKQRFFRVNPGAGEGSGLGLAIVDNIAKQLDIDWQMHESELNGVKHRFIFKLHA